MAWFVPLGHRASGTLTSGDDKDLGCSIDCCVHLDTVEPAVRGIVDIEKPNLREVVLSHVDEVLY